MMERLKPGSLPVEVGSASGGPTLHLAEEGEARGGGGESLQVSGSREQIRG